MCAAGIDVIAECSNMYRLWLGRRVLGMALCATCTEAAHRALSVYHAPRLRSSTMFLWAAMSAQSTTRCSG